MGMKMTADTATGTLIDRDPLSAEPIYGRKYETVTTVFALGDIRVLAAVNFSGQIVRAYANEPSGEPIEAGWSGWWAEA